MSNVLYTSDLHLGHAKVAEVRGFENVAAHDAWIINRWNDHIGKNDTVFILGDIAVDKIPYALSILAGLPGEKHLISGNHDTSHPLHHRGFNRNFKRYSEVFATVTPTRMRKVNNHPVMLSHFPYASFGDGSHRPGSRYDEWRVPDTGLPLLHGHTHGTERIHGNMMHVGIDAWGQPVQEAWVAEWLNRFYAPPSIQVGRIDLSHLGSTAITAATLHPYDEKFPIFCHDCKRVRMSLAASHLRGRHMVCLSCSLA